MLQGKGVMCCYRNEIPVVLTSSAVDIEKYRQRSVLGNASRSDDVEEKTIFPLVSGSRVGTLFELIGSLPIGTILNARLVYSRGDGILEAQSTVGWSCVTDVGKFVKVEGRVESSSIGCVGKSNR